MPEPLAYTLRKSKRAKRVRITIYCDGRVVVTAPVNVHQSIVERFVIDKTQWALKKLKFFDSIDNQTIQTFSHEDYLDHKNDAMELVQNRVAYYNRRYGFEYNRITIKNQKTRWGSCSSKQNINVNCKILFLPQELQDYIIVHELCHLKELNHSPRFWRLVQKALPNYQEIKKELRRRTG